MATSSDPQTTIDERQLEAPDLLEALEEREKRKNSKNELIRQFKDADERARALLAQHAIDEDEVVRVGRFRISKTVSTGRSVAFETAPSTQIRITPDKDE